MWELKSHPYLFGSGQVKWEVNKNHKAAVQCQPYFVITLLFHQTGHMGGGLQSFCIPLEDTRLIRSAPSTAGADDTAHFLVLSKMSEAVIYL